MSGAPRLSLAPASASPSAARRWLADQLAGYPEGMVADAALLLSEVVTNAVLHAGTPIEVAVHARDGVRVEVADGSTVLPSAKRYIADAATGRGLKLLEAMSAAWGVDLGPSGKVVWFDIATPVGTETAQPGVVDLEGWPDLESWPDVDAPPEADKADVAETVVELIGIRLIDVPLGLLKTTSEQYDALFRELRLIMEHGGESEIHAIPRQLLALSDELTSQYSSFTVSADTELRTAQDRGDETIDLSYRLPRDVGPASAHYDDLLDEADRWCRAGRELLTLAPNPGALAVRKWLLGEFVRQAAGEPPLPWPDSPWALQAAGPSDQ